MSLTRRALNKMAFCSSRLSKNNYISVSKKDFKTIDIQPNDEVRVLLIRSDLRDEDLKPRDKATYKTTLAKSSQIYCPKDVREKLDLKPGDTVRYFIIPAAEFPGLQDGPIRDKLRSVFKTVDSGGEAKFDEQERPKRKANMGSFSAKMATTGQVTVPAEVRNKLGLIQGDTINTLIKNPENGETVSVPLTIGTGNRITITKQEREEIGLEKGDEPEIRIMVPSSVPEA
jgi:AbrB family looped-hinge helix DNA binding protein